MFDSGDSDDGHEDIALPAAKKARGGKQSESEAEQLLQDVRACVSELDAEDLAARLQELFLAGGSPSPLLGAVLQAVCAARAVFAPVLREQCSSWLNNGLLTHVLVCGEPTLPLLFDAFANHAYLPEEVVAAVAVQDLAVVLESGDLGCEAAGSILETLLQLHEEGTCTALEVAEERVNIGFSDTRAGSCRSRVLRNGQRQQVRAAPPCDTSLFQAHWRSVPSAFVPSLLHRDWARFALWWHYASGVSHCPGNIHHEPQTPVVAGILAHST
jgi:hypothetical protein